MQLQLALVPLRIVEIILRSRTKFVSLDVLMHQVKGKKRDMVEGLDLDLTWTMLDIFIRCTEAEKFDDREDKFNHFTFSNHRVSVSPDCHIGFVKGGIVVVAHRGGKRVLSAARVRDLVS